MSKTTDWAWVPDVAGTRWWKLVSTDVDVYTHPDVIGRVECSATTKVLANTVRTHSDRWAWLACTGTSGMADTFDQAREQVEAHLRGVAQA